VNTILPKDVKQRLYNRYIVPTEKKSTVNAGIELELPIVNLRREAVDFSVVHELTLAFGKRFAFAADKYDDEGELLAVIDKDTGDILTFDCSYNTLEISLGIVDNLHDADTRLLPYLEFIQAFLQKREHTVVGLGINPHREYNNHIPIQNGRYRMLFRHLSLYEKHLDKKKFLPYPAFGMFTAASQIQLDILPGKLIHTLKIFNALEPFKSVLFANSPMKSEGLLLARDQLWSDSMQGYNPRNIGSHDPVPNTIDELLEYMLDASIYCTERGGKYFNFMPIPLRGYFTSQNITAEYWLDGGYKKETLVPALEDLAYFRTFKFQDPTFRGTVEFRSVCAQPLRERLTVAAFHLGLIDRLDELDELLAGDSSLYRHGFSAAELRDLLNREIWPDFIDQKTLSKALVRILNIADEGLRKRGKNEEVFLRPLYDRAEQLKSPAREYTERRAAGEKQEELILDYASLAHNNTAH